MENSDLNKQSNNNKIVDKNNTIATINVSGKDNQWRKKRWYYILPIAAVAVTTVITVPCAITCSAKSAKGTVELSSDVSKKGVSIKESNIVKGHESTFVLNVPQDKGISYIEITIGDKTYTFPEIKLVGNKVIIGADKMTDSKVIVKTVILQYLVPVTNVILDKTALTLKEETVTLTATVLPTNATNQKVTWESSNENIAIVDQNGKVTTKSIGETNITVTTDDGSKTATCAINVVSLNFATCSWDQINTYSTKLEDGEITTEKFCSYFTKDGTNAITRINDFIGLERTITINNQKHVIRVIGTQHDTITGTEKKAALTFESVTLLSQSDGNCALTLWDSFDHYNYTNSILRATLTGEGSGKSALSTNVLSLLPNELQSIVKNITKRAEKTSSYVPITYSDKVFSLTYTEIGFTDSTYTHISGTIYEYWKNHNTNNDRAKKTSNGSASSYWLVSPNLQNGNDNANYINDSGSCSAKVVYENCGIDFAFCI